MNPAEHTYKLLKRVVVTAVGSIVLLVGIVLIFIPGPAIVFIPLGLAILSAEYVWARSWLKKIREKISATNAQRRAQRSEQHRGDYSDQRK